MRPSHDIYVLGLTKLVHETALMRVCTLKLTEGSEVGDVVVDVLDGEAEDLDAHAADVGGGDFADEGSELVPILVHLLDG